MRLLLFFVLALCVRADVQTVTTNAAPNRIRPTATVLAAEWSTRLPPTGAVNAPGFLTTVYPGQRIAIGLLAEGADRAQAFDGAKLRVRAEPGPRSPESLRDLAPLAVRPLKAEGADFTLLALEAANLSKADLLDLAAKTTLVTLAVFAPDWTAPATDVPTEVTLTLELTGKSQPVTLEPLRLKVRPTADWMNGPPVAVEEVGKQMNRHRPGVAPGELLSWIRAFARSGQIRAPAVQAHFAFALRTNPAARAEAISACAHADPELQPALLLVLRRSGEDLAHLFPALPAAALEPFEAIQPLADPRALPRFRDPVDLAAVSKLGNTMDECWAGWMTTGDPSYLRALVDLLEGAPDFPAYVAWQKARTGAKGLNARVARGLGYQIAGWSIGSFQRTDPLVMDWLLYWQKDPTVSETVRREIAALPTNPAFRRK